MKKFSILNTGMFPNSAAFASVTTRGLVNSIPALNCSEEFPFLFDNQRALKAWQMIDRNPQKYQQHGPFILGEQ